MALNQKTTPKNHPNIRLTADDWCKRVKAHLNSLSSHQRRIVMRCWPSIKRGIDAATQYDNLDEFERFEDRKESYEYELLIQGTCYILKNEPPARSVIYWAKKLCSKRKITWYDCKIRQRDKIQIIVRPFEIEYGENGNIVDVGLSNSEYLPIANPPNPFFSNPEDLITNNDLSEIIEKLPSKVGSLERKRSTEHQRILELQLSGVDVKPCHGTQLGIKSSEVASLKHQAFNCAAKILSEFYPDLKEAQALFREQKGKSWRIARSTFNERKALYRDPNYEEPRLVRDWKVIEGSVGQGHADFVPATGINNSEVFINAIAV